MFIPFPISSESLWDRVRCKLGKCWSPCRLRSHVKTPIYSTAYSANFWPQVKNPWTLGSHQIRVFCHLIWVFYRRSEQLVGREARRELEQALAHVLGAEASPEAALTVAKHWPSRLTVAGLRRRSPPIKVSINTLPLSLWSRRSKPHRKLTTVARENLNLCNGMNATNNNYLNK
jgi:hypothetical protein